MDEISLNPPEYAREAIRQIIACLVKKEGVFEEIEPDALLVLQDAVEFYARLIAETSHGFSELAGRTQGNLNDIILTFESIGVKVEDLIRYISSTEELPFRYVPPFGSKAEIIGNKDVNANISRLIPRKIHSSNIPTFLPPFPPVHTYQKTRSHEQADKTSVSAERLRRLRSIEASFHRICGNMKGSQLFINTSIRPETHTDEPPAKRLKLDVSVIPEDVISSGEITLEVIPKFRSDRFSRIAPMPAQHSRSSPLVLQMHSACSAWPFINGHLFNYMSGQATRIKAEMVKQIIPGVNDSATIAAVERQISEIKGKIDPKKFKDEKMRNERLRLYERGETILNILHNTLQYDPELESDRYE